MEVLTAIDEAFRKDREIVLTGVRSGTGPVWGEILKPFGNDAEVLLEAAKRPSDVELKALGSKLADDDAFVAQTVQTQGMWLQYASV